MLISVRYVLTRVRYYHEKFYWANIVIVAAY